MAARLCTLADHANVCRIDFFGRRDGLRQLVLPYGGDGSLCGRRHAQQHRGAFNIHNRIEKTLSTRTVWDSAQGLRISADPQDTMRKALGLLPRPVWPQPLPLLPEPRRRVQADQQAFFGLLPEAEGCAAAAAACNAFARPSRHHALSCLERKACCSMGPALPCLPPPKHHGFTSHTLLELSTTHREHCKHLRCLFLHSNIESTRTRAELKDDGQQCQDARECKNECVGIASDYDDLSLQGPAECGSLPTVEYQENEESPAPCIHLYQTCGDGGYCCIEFGNAKAQCLCAFSHHVHAECRAAQRALHDERMKLVRLGCDERMKLVRLGCDDGAPRCRPDEGGTFICTPTVPCVDDGEPCNDDTVCCDFCAPKFQCEDEREEGDPPCPRFCDSGIVAGARASQCPGRNRRRGAICWKRGGMKHNCTGSDRCAWGKRWHRRHGWRSVGVCKAAPARPIFNCARPYAARPPVQSVPRPG